MCESQMNSFEKHKWNDGFTANDARILADNVRTEQDDKEYNEVSNLIYDAAKNGQYSMCLPLLSKYSENRLKELGYKVDRYSYLNDTEVKISWGGEDDNDEKRSKN